MIKKYEKTGILSKVYFPNLRAQFNRLAEMSNVGTGKDVFYMVDGAFTLARGSGFIGKTPDRRGVCFDTGLRDKRGERLFTHLSLVAGIGSYQFKGWVRESELYNLGFVQVPSSPSVAQDDARFLVKRIKRVELASYHVMYEHKDRFPTGIGEDEFIRAIERSLCRPGMIHRIVFHGGVQWAVPVCLKRTSEVDCYAIGVFDDKCGVLTILTKLTPEMMRTRLLPKGSDRVS
ncbi:DUF3825 domain-containing protein [uncultured Fibrobacter sp.]|uniref:DUF3825 domain-containing protein n=1 Tax=uncultured Fibrobacter sp. TaxID=261512 RepID=UPI0025D47752|nr:DUF3825 domain-containing protein [uncultured Fibrobacter sp.]